jgi:DNA-binding NtrC family response regulator
LTGCMVSIELVSIPYKLIGPQFALTLIPSDRMVRFFVVNRCNRAMSAWVSQTARIHFRPHQASYCFNLIINTDRLVLYKLKLFPTIRKYRKVKRTAYPLVRRSFHLSRQVILDSCSSLTISLMLLGLQDKISCKKVIIFVSDIGMKSILYSWIGFADLKASREEKNVGLGPIAQAVSERSFQEVTLICDVPNSDCKKYVKWLKTFTSALIQTKKVSLSSPTHFGDIYEAAVGVIKETLESEDSDVELTYHLSPGTPAMAAVWIIIAKTRYPATLIESSINEGVKVASVPFDLSAEFIPDLLRKPDEKLEKLTAGLLPEAPEFKSITHRSNIMKRIVAKARLIAPRSVPVLIEGDSGTGKELLARAIHNASIRVEKSFVAVNCGAIPSELIESELFGHEKGAFTGAEKQRIGYFEAANEGTLFLDEIGELPLAAQVKLLRALQEKEVTRLGASKPIPFDVRVIAATNRDLIKEIAQGRFRPDLFYRIAVAVLKLPPLKDRAGDVGLLIDNILAQINEESVHEPGYKYKKISAAAKNLMLQHAWPGNVRELQNTLTRAAIWSSGTTIDLADIQDALLPMAQAGDDGLLGKPLDDGINLLNLMEKLAQHYLKRALAEVNGSKTKAAELLGFSNYQTFTNWLKKYRVK